MRYHVMVVVHMVLGLSFIFHASSSLFCFLSLSFLFVFSLGSLFIPMLFCDLCYFSPTLVSSFTLHVIREWSPQHLFERLHQRPTLLFVIFSDILYFGLYHSIISSSSATFFFLYCLLCIHPPRYLDLNVDHYPIL